MRISSTLLAMTMAATPLVPIQAVSVIEKMRPHDVQLERLLDQPTAYMGMRVRFDATFAQSAGLFDTFHTGFTPEEHMNVVIWDDTANIWDPQVRAAPLTTLYFRKRREGAHVVSSLPKYTQVEIVGEVVSDFRGTPWIDCHEIIPHDGRGALSDNGVYHVQRAVQLAKDDAYELADEHYAQALELKLPRDARIAILRLRADNLLQAQDWEQADAVLTEALAASPEPNARLNYLKARAQAEMAQKLIDRDEDSQPLFQSAVEHATTAVSLDPQLGDAYAVLGISLAGLERFDEAKQQCQRAIRLLPENAEVRWYLGRILNLQGDYHQAIDVLKEAIDRAPKDDRLHKTIAKSYYERGLLGGNSATMDIETALREYDIAIRLNAEDPDLQHLSGLVLETATERGQEVRIGLKRVPATYDMAIERFEATLLIDPAYTDAHVRLGARYRAKEDHERAVQHYQRALELEPERDELYGFLGRYMWDLGKRAQAYEVFLGHHNRNPDYIDTLYALGRLSQELDEDARATEWYHKLLRLAQDHAQAHADLAESYVELGDDRRAITHGEQALELLTDQTEQGRVHRWLGLAYAMQDQNDQVIAHLDGRASSGEDIRLPLALGWALSLDPSKAANVEAMGQQAQDLDPEHAEGAELKAWGQYLAGNHAAAEGTLSSLYRNDPENDVLAYRLGLTLFAQGPSRYADAQPLLEQGQRVSSRLERLRNARGEAKTALRAIAVHNKQVARDQRDAEREAARKQKEAEREAAIKAREEARKQKEAQNN